MSQNRAARIADLTVEHGIRRGDPLGLFACPASTDLAALTPNSLANRDGVVADRDVAVPAAGGKQQGKNLERLPVGQHRAELGVQPFQFGRVRLAKVVLQRRNVPTTISPTSAALQAFADVGDPTDDCANLGAVTVVQLASRTTSKACPTGSTVLNQLLADSC